MHKLKLKQRQLKYSFTVKKIVEAPPKQSTLCPDRLLWPWPWLKSNLQVLYYFISTSAFRCVWLS